jgi:hypothetical protein
MEIIGTKNAGPSITISPTSASLTSESGVLNVQISSDGAWQIIEDSDWITSSASAGSNSQNVNFNYGVNDGTSQRSAEVIIGTEILTIVQTAAAPDTDGDGIFDSVDLDDDNDGVPDISDVFPLDPNESFDTDGDGIGDNADSDDDWVWTYSVSDSQATITGYSGIGVAVKVPSVVDGIPVVKVGNGGTPIFGDENTVTSITIPESVTSIGDYAFYQYTGLTSITIANSVTSIGYAAFQSCTSLTSITIPDSVTSIGDFAFRECTSLTSVTIGNSVTSIGYAAFYECTSLTSVTIPDSVTSIGDYAFNRCSSLTSITIPDSVTSIGEYAFYGCSSLASITVDAGNLNYSSVDGVLFNKLQTVLIQYPAGILDESYAIPDSVTSIGSGAFVASSSLASLTIPDSVTSIGDYAFNRCSSLASVTIPDSVTSIGDYAFVDCSSLTSVTLPILFIDSYPSFSLSSEQVLLYGSPAARDIPLSNSFAAGQNDVTSSPATYDLFTQTQLDARAESTTQAIILDPSSVGLFSQINLDEAISTATQAIMLDPSTVGLFASQEAIYFSFGQNLIELDKDSLTLDWSLMRTEDLSVWEEIGKVEIAVPKQEAPYFFRFELNQ